MKKIVFILFLTGALAIQAQVRTEIRIPDIPGYRALKCDFHVHSVFSDGSVWPSIRVEEAYIEGLDAVAITEHIEYRPHHSSKDMQSDHNRAYDIAAGLSQGLDIIVIRGSEITRGMPPGHSNAIFLQSSNPLDTPEYEDAFKEAARQKAFIFWNHPGWDAQAPETTKWYDEHTQLHGQGYMHGIELANSADDYYPEAHQWALDKGLTMLGNSDIHKPTGMSYDFAKGEHRTMTLVFAKERTAESIREALDAGRTAVWIKDIVAGREDLLRELFKQTLRIEKVDRHKNGVRFTVKNDSDFNLTLRKTATHDMNLHYFRELFLKPGQRTTISVGFRQPTSGKVKIDFTVDNFYPAPNKGLTYSLEAGAEK